MSPNDLRIATKAIHAGQQPDPTTGAIMTPVYMTSTYIQSEPGVHQGYDYSRSGNPTRTALEANLAGLEGGKYGLSFASGLAAENTLLHLLGHGDHVVSARDVYGGTYRLFEQVWRQLGVTYTTVDATSLVEIKEAIQPNTRMVWLESPSNPLLTCSDIQAAVELAKPSKAWVVVDNTFATPILQQPLSLGADVVLHSVTKYLGGHSDVIGGALITNNDELHDRLRFLQNATGSVPGPMDCFLVLRGTKTLSVRMKQHCENAMIIAEHLAAHPEVERVYYPGLENNPSHAVAKRQMTGFGGMVSVELAGDFARNRRFACSTQLFSLAESLGGVESLINHPASMTHASIPKEERERGGLSDSLMRLSVGIEDAQDLIEDLEQAITRSKSPRTGEVVPDRENGMADQVTLKRAC
ncbi:MAG: cystathionine gamma-synthase [Mariniblastus sp.]|nr:cystathionine gamma-synthase [Mariniblastus sp.]